MMSEIGHPGSDIAAGEIAAPRPFFPPLAWIVNRFEHVMNVKP
jgi:hypothetical protein